jgi:hypothetical protein
MRQFDGRFAPAGPAMIKGAEENGTNGIDGVPLPASN